MPASRPGSWLALARISHQPSAAMTDIAPAQRLRSRAELDVDLNHSRGRLCHTPPAAGNPKLEYRNSKPIQKMPIGSVSVGNRAAAAERLDTKFANASFASSGRANLRASRWLSQTDLGLRCAPPLAIILRSVGA